MARRAVLLAAMMVSVLVLASTAAPTMAWAHGGDRAFVPLLPTGYYLAGGTLAVAATFLLLALLPKGISYRLAGARLPLMGLRPPSPIATSLLAFMFLAFLLATGFAGSRDPLSNPLPLTVWTLWWVGFTLATAVLGNLWAYVNPWTGPYQLAMRLRRTWGSKLSEALAATSPPPSRRRRALKMRGRDRVRGIAVAVAGSDHFVRGGSAKAGGQPTGRWEPPLPYPTWLGYWPAIVLFFGFAWFELIDIAPDDPERLAVAAGAYWLFTFIALLLFGEEAWLGRAEPFSVFFRFIGRLSPLVWTPEKGDDETRQRLTLAMPGAALLDREALPPSGVLFILLTLASVSFDGLSKTFWWLGLNGINPLEFPGRSAVVGINSAGLLLTWAVLAVLYTAAVLLGWWLAARPAPRALPGTLVFSIMPISLGFHFSHYLTALLVNGQYALAAASDPFGTGRDVLSLGHFHVTTSFLNTYEGTRAIWNAQTAGIVAGHVLAVLLAHELACRSVRGYRAAVVSQVPLAAVMVAYTLFGLWLLSTPVAG